MFKKDKLKITIPIIIIIITNIILIILDYLNLTSKTTMKWYELLIGITELLTTYYFAYQLGKQKRNETKNKNM